MYLEKDELFDLSNLINEVVEKYNNKNISKIIPSEVYFTGRKNLIKKMY